LDEKEIVKKQRLIAALLMMATAPVFAQSISMQAYKIGDSFERVKEDFALAYCSFSDHDGRQLKGCIVPIRDYAVPLRDTIFFFGEDRLEKIQSTFDSANFYTLLSAATVKYGKPTKVFTFTMRNALGAVIPSKTAVWVRSGLTYSISEKSDFLADGLLTISREIVKRDDSAVRAGKM